MLKLNILFLLLITCNALNCVEQSLAKVQIEPYSTEKQLDELLNNKQTERRENFIFLAEYKATELIVKLIALTQIQYSILQMAQKKAVERIEVTINDCINVNNKSLCELPFNLDAYQEMILEIENTDIDDSKPEDFENDPGEYTYFKITEKLWDNYHNQITKLFNEKIMTYVKYRSWLENIELKQNYHVALFCKYLPVLKKENNEESMEPK
ncbi:MAG: hypothetical protein P4L22_05700 [Candidatus Babeliales bacterium]|nr:hypothetical protein [Candidatus Babeliales bacterium]